jgi:flagella basal body P-ring formation protein FlgA
MSTSVLASTGANTLLSQAQQWIAQTQGTTPDLITMQAIDRRIDVPACPKGWAFEAPFAGQPSVRASCDSPKAQLFVQWKSPRLTATLVPTREAPVPAPAKTALAASRTLPRGSHLEASMVQWVEVPASQWSAHHLSDMSVLNGSELMRDMVPGQIIRRQDIRPSVLVKKGQMVSFQVGQSSDFMITAKVQALQDGRMGEQIRLKNPDSGRILSGKVTGLNAVKTP